MDIEQVFEWQIISPKHVLVSESNFLEKVAHFRTKIFSQDKNRKGFAKGDADKELDKNSYHIVAYVNSEIVGYNRITPLHADIDCIFSRAYGKEYFQTVYQQFATNNPLSEVSRWSIDPRFSPHFLGIKVFAGFWALIIKLKHNAISINSKTTNFSLQQGGAKLITNDSIYSDYYNDTIVPLLYQYHEPPIKLTSLIHQMKINLNIDNLKI